MRIFGIILVVIGLLVCLTIIGIPAGVFLIFVGLVLIALGSRQRTTITNVVQVSTTPGQQSFSMESDERGGRAVSPPRQSPMIDVTPRPHPSPTNSRITAHSSSGGSSRAYQYDYAKWQALVEFDGEIAEIERVLRPYGQKYVDQFAAGYLALNEKTYVQKIMDKVIETARDDAAKADEAEERWRNRFSDPSYVLKFAKENFECLTARSYGNVALLRDGSALLERNGQVSKYNTPVDLRDAMNDQESWFDNMSERDKVAFLTVIIPYLQVR